MSRRLFITASWSGVIWSSVVASRLTFLHFLSPPTKKPRLISVFTCCEFFVKGQEVSHEIVAKWTNINWLKQKFLSYTQSSKWKQKKKHFNLCTVAHIQIFTHKKNSIKMSLLVHKVGKNIRLPWPRKCSMVLEGTKLSSSLTISRCPRLHASCKGVQPALSQVFTSIPVDIQT